MKQSLGGSRQGLKAAQCDSCSMMYLNDSTEPACIAHILEADRPSALPLSVMGVEGIHKPSVTPALTRITDALL